MLYKHFMRYCLKLILLVFLLASCTKATDKAAAPMPDRVIGSIKNNVYSVVNTKDIKHEWETALAIAGDTLTLDDFKIEKSVTTGDSKIECFMIMAKSSDGKTSVAALINQKDNYFYFIEDNFVSVVCKAECKDGCLPVALSYKGVVKLVCSNCTACIKSDVMVNLPSNN